MTDQPPFDPLGERLAKLEGVVETEDKMMERSLENTKHTQGLIIGVVGLLAAGAIAFLVYVLQRLDTIQAAHG